MWLDVDKSWDAVTLQVHRKHELQHKAKSGYQAIQGKHIMKEYNEEKAKKVIASRKESGLWYPDPDFPSDDEEPWLVFGDLICWV